MFTTACFIRINPPELRKKLKELGYYVSKSADQHPILYCFEDIDNRGVMLSNVSSTTEEIIQSLYGDFIDCGANEQLFLALAALRSDSDYMQWFTDAWGSFKLCKEEYNTFSPYANMYKATPDELIKHFKLT